MEEKEIEKLLKPDKKRMVLLFLFLSIAIVCIGNVFYGKFVNHKEEEAIVLSELIESGKETQGKYVKLEINSVPIFLIENASKDNYLYCVTDLQEHSYLISLSGETFKNIIEKYDAQTGKLTSTHLLEGVTNQITEEMKKSVLANEVLKSKGIYEDNFSEQLGNVYIKEQKNSVSQRGVTLYTISALIGVFFLVLAFGYIVPAILARRKIGKDKEFVEELRTELEHLTDTPYKEQHIYLTKNYVVSAIEAIRYEDIVWGYILQESKYGIKLGENLLVHTKDKKKHIIGSVVGTKKDVLDSILEEIKSKNPNIRIGYDKENEEFFKNG